MKIIHKNIYCLTLILCVTLSPCHLGFQVLVVFWKKIFLKFLLSALVCVALFLESYC